MTATRDQRRRRREREKAHTAELRAPALAAAEAERKRWATWSLWENLRTLPGPRQPDRGPFCGHGRHDRYHAPHGLLDVRRRRAAEEARQDEATRKRSAGFARTPLGMLMLAAVLGGGK